jgi:hypothetical protein
VGQVSERNSWGEGLILKISRSLTPRVGRMTRKGRDSSGSMNDWRELGLTVDDFIPVDEISQSSFLNVSNTNM